MKLISCLLVACLVAGATAAALPSASSLLDFVFGGVFTDFDELYSHPEQKVKFSLFTRNNPTEPTVLYSTDALSKITGSTFDPKKLTKLVVHGFMSHQALGTAGYKVKDALLKLEDSNVILVDWSAMDSIRHMDMTSPAKVVPLVGNEVAAFMKNLIAAGLPVESFHLIAHSLGTHMAGHAGSIVLGPAKAGRITALDPVGKMFENAAPDARLDPTDAGYVVAIHTDAGLIGIKRNVGHVDFFPDGGHQPHFGCSSDLIGVCSHCSSYQLLLRAIVDPTTFVGTKCASWAEYQKGACAKGDTATFSLTTDASVTGSYFFTSKVYPTKMQALLGRDIMGFVFDLTSDFVFNNKRDIMAILTC